MSDLSPAERQVVEALCRLVGWYGFEEEILARTSLSRRGGRATINRLMRRGVLVNGGGIYHLKADKLPVGARHASPSGEAATPSPLMGEGRGEGDCDDAPPTPALPREGGGGRRRGL